MGKGWLFTMAVLLASTVGGCSKDDCIAACERGADVCGFGADTCPSKCDQAKGEAEKRGCTKQLDAAFACVADANNQACVNGAWGSPDCASEQAALNSCMAEDVAATGGGSTTSTGAGGAGGS